MGRGGRCDRRLGAGRRDARQTAAWVPHGCAAPGSAWRWGGVRNPAAVGSDGSYGSASAPCDACAEVMAQRSLLRCARSVGGGARVGCSHGCNLAGAAGASVCFDHANSLPELAARDGAVSPSLRRRGACLGRRAWRAAIFQANVHHPGSSRARPAGRTRARGRCPAASIPPNQSAGPDHSALSARDRTRCTVGPAIRPGRQS